MNKTIARGNTFDRALIAIAAGAILATGLAQASVSSEARRRVDVQYSKHELASRQGVHNLYARLKSAARQVCPDFDARDLGRAAQARACYEQALSDAVSQISLPALSLVHARQTGRGAG